MLSTPSLDPKEAAEMLSSLTGRQVAVMELAAQHKSNKVIAHELDISPSTVEQRMGYVRDKLETSDRNETIRRFVELRTVCGEPIYGIAYLEPVTVSPQTNGHGTVPEGTTPEGVAQQAPFLKALDGKLGRWGRIGLIGAIATLIVLIALVMLSVANSLSELLA